MTRELLLRLLSILLLIAACTTTGAFAASCAESSNLASFNAAKTTATQLELDFGQSLPWQRGESGLVIGRHADLSTPGALRPGEYRLNWFDVRDSLGDAANLSVNQSKIDSVLDFRLPVRDASPLSDVGSPYLNLERSSALGRQWFYEGGQWLPATP